MITEAGFKEFYHFICQNAHCKAHNRRHGLFLKIANKKPEN
jgi:hypothetical protein